MLLGRCAEISRLGSATIAARASANGKAGANDTTFTSMNGFENDISRNHTVSQGRWLTRNSDFRAGALPRETRGIARNWLHQNAIVGHTRDRTSYHVVRVINNIPLLGAPRADTRTGLNARKALVLHE